MPIALYAGHGYTEARTELLPGDLLFFYTDGLVETENEQKEMFGARTAADVTEKERSQDIDSILHHIEQSITAFRGSASRLMTRR